MMYWGLEFSKPFHRSSEVFIRNIIGSQKRESLVFHSALTPLTLEMAFLGRGLEQAGCLLLGQDHLHLSGSFSEKEDVKHLYKFFSLNACMFWGGLPISFGGVLPARERLDPLTDLIAEQNPDFLLMQEVAFGPALDIYGKLKTHYAHFYTLIGANLLGLESCLFFASKYPIVSEPFFVPFEKFSGMMRGMFVVETSSFWIINAHMSPGELEQHTKARREQLAVVQNTIGNLKKRANKPCFFIGDLYTSRRKGDETDDYVKLGIQEHFFDPYYQKFPKVNAEAATYTSYLNNFARNQEYRNLSYEIDDFVFLDLDSKDLLDLKIDVIDTFSEQDPAKALSDHRALVLEVSHLIKSEP